MITKRAAAGNAVQLAVKNGDLPPLDGSVLCVDCGAIATDYDHRDYDEPLKVEPTCRSCNGKRGPAKGWIVKQRKDYRRSFYAKCAPMGKRKWPGVHVRLELGVFRQLERQAKKNGRSTASEATHLLTIYVLSMAIKEEGKHGD